MAVALATQLTTIVEQAPLGEVALPYEIKSRIVYSKYESQNPMVSDTQHGEVWTEQAVTNERLGLGEEHGCIIDFKGTARGEVGITPQGEVLDLDAIDIRESASNQRVPRYMAYDFRVEKLTKTDGPIRRENLQRTYEQQRLESEKNLLDVIAGAMAKGFSTNPVNGGQLIQSASPSDLMSQLASLDPAQRKAMLEEVEDQNAEVVTVGNSKKGR